MITVKNYGLKKYAAYWNAFVAYSTGWPLIHPPDSLIPSFYALLIGASQMIWLPRGEISRYQPVEVSL